MKNPSLLISTCLALSVLCASTAFPDGDKPNVLFIAVDDLRPQLGCYGQDRIVSPNIDRLAAQGVLFERSYCMVPTCGASRASLMTGIRPAPKRFVNFLARADEDAPGIVTLNTHCKNNGYKTLSLGKVFHSPQDNAEGWSEGVWRPRGPTYLNPESVRIAQERAQARGPRNRNRGPAVESADVSDEAYRDGKLAQRAVGALQNLADTGAPFFLAVGFFKPHLPFVAPKKYWDMYQANTIRLPDNYFAPENAPTRAIHSWGELRAYAGVPIVKKS